MWKTIDSLKMVQKICQLYAQFEFVKGIVDVCYAAAQNFPIAENDVSLAWNSTDDQEKMDEEQTTG